MYGKNHVREDREERREEVKNGERTKGGPSAVTGDWVFTII